MRKDAQRATAYFFTGIVGNDPNIAYAVELLRRDSTAIVELRHDQALKPIVFDASQREQLVSFGDQIRGHRASFFVDYDKSTPLPTAVVALPISTTLRRRQRRVRAA